MALNKSNLMIRDYENIRHILRDIFIFGCFTRDDFIDMGISGRKYDNEQRRINAYLPEKFINKRRVNKKVLLYCTYNMADSSEIYLAETYRNKSFTMLDVMSYFFVLQILSRNEDMTLAEILQFMPNNNDEVVFTKDNLRAKLEELHENGLIETHKEGRSVKYRLCSDIWADFEDEELLDIYLYLDFLKNVSPLEMPYYFLQRKLKLYLAAERLLDIDDVDEFQFKHNHLFNSLDNDVLLEILKAIYQKRLLRIKREGRDGVIEFVTIPVKVIHDSTYGRQYFICYNEVQERVSVIRIDKIIDAFVEGELSQKQVSISKGRCNSEKDCWCTSGVDNELSVITIEFSFDENKEEYILNRIDREGHGGSVEKIAEGLYQYKVLLRDPNEMIPWIRSFGERAKVISSNKAGIEEKIAADWEKAVKKYEAIQ